MNITVKNLENMERLLNMGAWPSKADFLDVVRFAKEVVLDTNKQIATVTPMKQKPIDDRYVCFRCGKEWVYGSPRKVCPDCKRIEGQKTP